jgi:hypothetical protein
MKNRIIMKNIIKFPGILVIVLMMLLGACGESFLELEPNESVSENVAITNVSDVEVAVNGMYNDLQDGGWLGGSFVMIPSIMGDGIRLTSENSNRYTAEYNYSIQDNYADVYEMWQEPYKMINKANNLLAKIDDIEGDETLLNHYKGVAIGLRAMAHFDMLRMFAHPYSQGGEALGIPIVTEVLEPTAEPARNTVAEVYTQIITDLTDAIGLLDQTKIEDGYFHYWGAKAILARVYLYHEDWALAAQTADEVINSGEFSLASNVNYQSIFADMSSESVFEIINTSVDNDALTPDIGFLIHIDGYGDVVVTHHLRDLLATDPSDVRNDLLIADKEGTSLLPNKFPNGDLGTDNNRVIRLSELYLIAAEGYAKSGNDATGLARLNSIVSRASAGTTLTGLTGTALVNRILVEREKELFCEGHRLFDLTRNNMVINRGGDDQWSDPDYHVVQPDDNKTIFPIPDDEIDVNDNMVQNAGY